MKVNIKSCLIAGIITLASNSCNSNYKKVEVKETGTLSQQLSAEQWANIKSLAVEGPLNNCDIAFIKALDNNGLEKLDLSKAGNMKHILFFFDNNKFSSIVLPDSVTNIDPESFQCCKNLKEVKLDVNNKYFKVIDSVLYSIDTTRIVIYPAKLSNKTFTIPAKVTSLSNCTFAESSLEEIKVASGNKVYLSENGVLYSKDKQVLLAYPTNKKDTIYTLPKEVKMINWSALWSNKNLRRIEVEAGSYFKSIDGVLVNKNGELVCYPAGKQGDNYTLPNSIKSIGSCAFRGSNVTSLNLTDSLFSIDKWSFKGSNIKDIKATGTNFIAREGIIYSGNSVIVCAPAKNGRATLAKALAITERALQNSEFEELTIEPTMIVGPFACSYSSKLKKAILKEGIEDIKGQGMFFCCTSLEEVELPSTLTNISEWMFFGCIKLNKLTVKSAKCPEFGQYAFDGIDLNKCTLYVPEKSIDRYKNDKNWSKFKDIRPIK